MLTRPLSPHLQIYRLPLTALLSISHRITGLFLSLGLILIALVLASAAIDPESYEKLSRLLSTTPGSSFIWIWIYLMLFHACHGVRHLLWDAGYGLEKSHLIRHDLLELTLSILLTLTLFGLNHSLPANP